MIRSAALVVAAVLGLAVESSSSASAPPFFSRVDRVTAAELSSSWRPGCPVGPADLRRVRLAHWDFDGDRRLGALVVHRDAVPAVVSVFRRLYAARFPIRRVRPIEAYSGDDDASMAADNTSAFNCRAAVSSGPRRWSQHAYGRAVDVNPVENPYLLGGRVLPPAGARFVDRTPQRPGMAVSGGVLVRAFAAAGWSWGGTWRSPDYQHFSATGS